MNNWRRLVMTKRPASQFVLISLACCTAVVWAQSATKQAEVPDGFEQILPRGGIPAINNPTYVESKEAKISDEAFVLGVVIDGEPLAYSLNLLNRHEIVNDSVGETNFAAVW